VAASLPRGSTASGALVGCWLLGALLGWGGETQAAWASDVSLVVLALYAAARLGLAARRRPVGRRLPFVLLAAGCLLWATGEALWTWYELVLGQEVPFPSVADLAYLGAAPVAGCGLLWLSRGLRQRSHRARAALDGWLVAGSCLTVGWVFLLAPVARDAEGGAAAVTVAVAYPVLDLVLATVALLAFRNGGRGQRDSVGFVAAAVLGMALADSAFTLLELRGVYESGGVVDVGWVAAYLLFGLAGSVGGEGVPEVDSDAPVGRAAVLLPYAVVLVAVSALGIDATVSGVPDPVALGLLASVVLALVVRQALTALDNAALASLLSLRERHFRSLVQGAKDVIVLCGRDLETTYVSPSSLAVLGLEPDEIVGRKFWEIVHPEDVGGVRDEVARVLAGGPMREGALLRCRILSGDGWIDTESTVGDFRHDPSVAGIVITTRDVSERTALEAQLRTLAWQDPLTGLANRTLFRDRVIHALAQRRPVDDQVGLVIIDLDSFKPVNDSHGHSAGDALLVEVAKRLLAGVRDGDTVARLGGDEFAVLLEVGGLDRLPGGGLEVAERLLASLKEPYVVDGHEVSVGASLGLAVAAAGTDAEALVRNADLAMYASKAAGRGRITVFGADLAQESTRRGEVAHALTGALAAGELHLDYQPVVDLATGTVTGAEALARWDHPLWGSVPPSEFIPEAERVGLIVELGRWALLGAARQGAAWHAAGVELGVAVNVSVRQLGPEFVDDVARVLDETGIPSARLTLEITESLLVDDERTLTSLQALRLLGVRLSLDDFGTGWSSLAYLRRLPVDVLKLDGSFVAGLGTAQADAVSRTVVRLGSELGLEVVAEGVETEEQRALLLSMGCQSAQGWLFGRPGPAESVAGGGSTGLPSPRHAPDDACSVPGCETCVSGVDRGSALPAG
jgi:diguanylate cyclase (GGDEF)-like protein/PAS domain S-box-containing protein